MPPLDEAWWRAFGEPQLDALIAKALADHPSLQSAEARVRAAHALVNAARADTQPQLTGSFNTTRERFTG
ncbi:MAG TPA: TolC family protein, partial [Candidatus Binatia bacterium]|nr:TolC family protein [Candidatus Binatia bacterium]